MLGMGNVGRAALALALGALALGCDDNVATPTGTGGGGGGSGGDGGFWDGTGPNPAYLPKATGVCPEFASGPQTFAPDGIPPRQVLLAVGDAPGNGPLVFYWHALGSEPGESFVGLGPAHQQILDAGGIVAAPYHDPAAGQFPWFLTDGGEELDDLLVADEVVACAIEKAGVDKNRIHAIGMSAGALQTVQVGYRRNGYIASIVPYSGGLLALAEPQDVTNLFPAMIFHGGPGDEVIVNFKDLSEALLADLESRGHYAFICDHGMGHDIPPAPGPESAWQFFQDHPFGTAPSPYAGGLPNGFPDYCLR